MSELHGPTAVLRAMAFARDAGAPSIEDWMFWDGWQLYIGCDRCVDGGPGAPCWGRQRCHGYEHSCGCAHCTQRQARELAETRAA